MTGKKPDFDVSALNKRTEERGQIGGAWRNEDGTISVVLNSFVRLHGGKEMLITLFPRRESKEASRAET